MIKKGDRAAIVCCSNGLSQKRLPELELLVKVLSEIGLEPILSDFLYERADGAAGTAKERGQALMSFYREPSVKVIFDLSGGDMANEILPYLDYDVIGQSGKQFWGYSDLTTVINAIYTKTGNTAVLYQIRNLIGEFSERQKTDIMHTLFEDKNELFHFQYRFCQGRSLQGIVVGGNIRCLLKLAGTEYFPDVTGKVLLLEAFHGSVPQLTTYFSQLQQMGAFHRAAGILLGTFTQMEQEKARPDAVTLLKRFIDPNLSIVKSEQIGHGTDSKGIVIGQYIDLQPTG